MGKMNKKLLCYTLYTIITLFAAPMASAHKPEFIKTALDILEKCMKHDNKHIAKCFNKKIKDLLAQNNLHQLIEHMLEAEAERNPYILNGVATVIAEKLHKPVSGQKLAALHEQLSSFSYALIIEHIKCDGGFECSKTRSCTGTPLSIADYVAAFGVPIFYLGNIGILLFDDSNINSLNGLQDISIPEVAFVALSNNCIVGSDLDPNFPTDPFQGMPNTSYFFADNNLIENLPSTFFHSASFVSEIFLGNNLLTTLPEGLFSNLDELGLLELSYNMLTTVTTTDILNLAALNMLFLDHNSLVDIPSDLIDGNPELIYLFLNDNVLASWPSTALNNVDTSMYVDLSNNNLTNFEPESIPDGSEIILAGNPLTSSQQDFLVASFPNVYFIF